MPDTRVNLHVYAIQEGKPVYHVLHIGFFPPAATKGIIARLNARGIAFHSDVANQTGVVDIVTCQMGPNPNNPEIVARVETYEPPRAKES